MCNFKLQNDLIRLGPNEFACPFCSKIMKVKRYLTRHICTHTGEKPFPCNYCNSHFNTKNGRYQHIERIHFKK